MMSTFKSIKDLNITWKNIDDKEVLKKILEENFNLWRQLTDILRKNIEYEFSYLGEIFVNLPEKIDPSLKNKLEKYFNVRWNKIWSRGTGYYWLFWDAYKVANRTNKGGKNKIIYKYEFWESFWEEYDEYINTLDSLKNNKELLLLYLDNYRNFVLLWIYILIIIEKSHSNQKIKPIQNMSFKSINTDKLDQFINDLSMIYEIIIDNMISISLKRKKNNIFMLPSIQSLYDNIKHSLKDKDIITTKKGKISLEDYFKNNDNNLKIWFEKIFRNIREEDNVWIMLSFFLQKKINLNNISDNNSIFELIMNFKKSKKKEYIIWNMYWGIELALLAKYFWYDSGLVNFSTYHFWNKNTYENIEDIYYPLNDAKLDEKEVIILDDNVYSWQTLEKVRTIFENNHISIKHLASSRLYISKQNKKISELKKHIALNSLYILPRSDKKNRNLNILVERKIKQFKKKYWKEFRSL